MTFLTRFATTLLLVWLLPGLRGQDPGMGNRPAPPVPFAPCLLAMDGDLLLLSVSEHYEESGGNLHRAEGQAYVSEGGGGGWLHLDRDPGQKSYNFGNALAVSGDTAAVAEKNAFGAVWIFRRGSTGWVRQARLESPGRQQDDGFGASLVLQGDTLLVGSPARTKGFFSQAEAGAVFVYVRKGQDWKLQARLEDPDFTRSGGFGGAVALSGDWAAVGASDEDGPTGVAKGVVHLFKRHGSHWKPAGRLDPLGDPDTSSFGQSLSMDGEAMAVGARTSYGDPPNNTFGPGRAYVFRRRGEVWDKEARLSAPNAPPRDGFGFYVTLSGSRLASSGWHEPGGGNLDAYVFSKNEQTWDCTWSLRQADPDCRELVAFALQGDRLAAFCREPRSEGGTIHLHRLPGGAK